MDIIELPLGLSCDLRKSDKLHLIYASQLYQTFFAIFGAFKIEKKENKNHLTRMALILINYKGFINLGITGLSKPQIDEKDKIKFYIKVKAGENSTVLQEFNFEKDSVPIEDQQEICFERILEPFVKGPNQTGMIDNYIFDSEFYERDGLYNQRKSYRFDDIKNEAFKEASKNPNGYHKHRNNSKVPCKNLLEERPSDSIFISPAEMGDEFLNGIPKIIDSGRCPRATLSIIIK